MANIYVRLPWYVAAFYRGLDEEKPLTEWQPVEFSDYTHEGVVLSRNLRIIPPQNQSSLCLSQVAWNSLLRGRNPVTGKRILTRDPKQWPTPAEVNMMFGNVSKKKQDVAEYLCVRMPDVVVLNARQVQPNSSYALAHDTAKTFCLMLRQEFYHVFLDWFEQDIRYCNRMGIHRENSEVTERFLLQYNIPTSINNGDKDSLRRMKNRWIENARKRPNDRYNFATPYLEKCSREEAATSHIADVAAQAVLNRRGQAAEQS